MTIVIKRNKKKQIYSMAKLERSIQKAAREAKLGVAKGKQLAREVAVSVNKLISRRKAVKSTELRRRVLRRLESRSRAAILAWRRYEGRKIR